MTLFGREPAVIIGLVVTIILGAVSTLLGDGFISDVTAGKVTDAVNAIAQLAVLAAPLIAGILIRPRVTPV
jgi:ABC-type transporter Mla maintaining outer membrane lipid asymmetry permease subunit MlaE